MLGLLILLVAIGLGFALGYGIREIISRKRRAKYRAYARYFETPRPPINVSTHTAVDSGRRLRQQPNASLIIRAISIVAESVSLALAVDFALALVFLLLLPAPS